ncbi:MAG: hypothetical protein N3G75_07675 [Methanothrix sp.]|nr:hypothetical protein [Methanothrix sp.]MCX8207693.1 hypothetical protein [Methanothrix sp.]
MPNMLSDLELDEVSLVGKSANGRKFLVFKSKGESKMTTVPTRAESSRADEALVSKAAIMDIIQKAVEPIAKENRELRKELERQNELLRHKNYIEVSKEYLGELVSPEEGASILKALENVPSDARKVILKSLKQANAVKREASKLLYHPMGSSRPAPGSAMEEFNALVEKRMSEIRKSGSAGSDPKVLRALATQEITRERPELARAVLAEERANTMKAQLGAI